MNKSYRQSWNIERARKYYNIPIWGEGYFDISEKGHVVACLDDDIHIDLGAGQSLSFNGVTYDLPGGTESTIRIHGGEGEDSLRIIATDGDETVWLGADSVQS